MKMKIKKPKRAGRPKQEQPLMRLDSNHEQIRFNSVASKTLRAYGYEVGHKIDTYVSAPEDSIAIGHGTEYVIAKQAHNDSMTIRCRSLARALFAYSSSFSKEKLGVAYYIFDRYENCNVVFVRYKANEDDLEINEKSTSRCET